MKYCSKCNLNPIDDDMKICNSCKSKEEFPLNTSNNTFEPEVFEPEILDVEVLETYEVDLTEPAKQSTVFDVKEAIFGDSTTSDGESKLDTSPYIEVGNKSKIIAGILAILLGNLGIYSFYLGFSSKGVLQLCLTLLSCGLFSPIVTVWSIIDGISILTNDSYLDADGKRLS